MQTETHQPGLPHSLIHAWMDTEREIEGLRKERAGRQKKKNDAGRGEVDEKKGHKEGGEEQMGR